MSTMVGCIAGLTSGVVTSIATTSTANVLFGMARMCPNPIVKVIGYTGAAVGTCAVGFVSALGATGLATAACGMADEKEQTRKRVKA